MLVFKEIKGNLPRESHWSVSVTTESQAKHLEFLVDFRLGDEKSVTVAEPILPTSDEDKANKFVSLKATDSFGPIPKMENIVFQKFGKSRFCFIQIKDTTWNVASKFVLDFVEKKCAQLFKELSKIEKKEILSEVYKS